MRAAVAAIVLLLAGCASNGVTVHEKTADGYEFSMTQKTISTWGSRTEEGAGSVDYEGNNSDGTGFKLRAGAAVQGQQAGDPSALVLGIMESIMPVISQSLTQRSASEAPPVIILPQEEE